MRWLNKRYRQTTPAGIYFAHQPIYGPQDANSEPNLIERYIRTVFILGALSNHEGSTLLDVGASEGYQANLARHFLGLKVTCTDLAFEAGRRAGELFSLAACQSDAHRLPFPDGGFDFVTCSETLEHIPDCRQVIDEMLRLAKKSVIITVPHEDPDKVEPEEIHGHINAFESDSLNYLHQRGMQVLVTPMVHNYMFRFSRLAERLRKQPYLPRGTVVALLSLFVWLDQGLKRLARDHACLGYVILKDPSAWQPQRRARFPLYDVIAWRRAPYTLR